MGKSLSKTQKKIDNNICQALSQVCEKLLDEVEGFQWLTHQADYKNFPASLMISCVFDTEAQRRQLEASAELSAVQKLIQSKLLQIGVKFKAIKQQIVFDSEEACSLQHEGQWSQRLASRSEMAVPSGRVQQ